ncbi:AAA family ATPase [Streptomyces sp. NPDC090108]|uniref:AAA family ATPase n=1 Tax=Streptomyces sp. NPDC090108 TaxID=3365947 RepID=UPI003808D21A
MRLVAVSIKNFRGVNGRTSVAVNDFTALAGMNNSGKSTLLEALDIFFSEKAPDKEDLCKSATEGKSRKAAATCNRPLTAASLPVQSTSR